VFCYVGFSDTLRCNPNNFLCLPGKLVDLIGHTLRAERCDLLQRVVKVGAVA
jgi:hypothetical protein